LDYLRTKAIEPRDADVYLRVALRQYDEM
jgi:hypothetical protein